MSWYFLNTGANALTLIIYGIILVPLCFLGTRFKLGDGEQKLLAAIGFGLFMFGYLFYSLAIFAFLGGVWDSEARAN